MAQFLTAFITYRIARPLRLGAGISNISWQEYIREETTIGLFKNLPQLLVEWYWRPFVYGFL
ncbi:MAG: hypothetical protein U1F16_05215 [Turneriella sp.]